MAITPLPVAGIRDHGTEQASLRPLLSPRSVAVIGALQRHGGAGYETVRALRDFGFHGRLCPVNGSGRPVCGAPGYPAIADLPEGVDLLVLAVPPDRVPRLLREAGRRRVRSAVVLSRSSATTGPSGLRRRQELLRLAREQGIRLVGPNSLGVLNTDPRVRLNASLSPTRPRAGGLAMASESGAVGIALLEHAAHNGCGVAAFVSLGDRVDVSSNDLLRHWHADPHVRAVALQLDSFGNPIAFSRAVRAITRSKPVLVMTSEPVGASLDNLLAEAGVVRASSLDEMTDAARMLADQPLPAGRRLGIVGNAGGLTVLAARTADSSGFVLPALGRVRWQLPAGQDNPIDLGIDAAPKRIAEAAEIVAGSGEIDILLLMIVGTRANVPDAIMSAVADVIDAHPHLTAAAVLTGCAEDVHHLGARAVPVYREQDRAIRALAHAHRYTTWRRASLDASSPY